MAYWKYKYAIIFCALCNIGFGQIIENFHPLNHLFAKVEYAITPEIKENRRGLLFYQLDTSKYNRYVELSISEILKSKGTKLQRLKYRGKRGRFDNYKESVQSIYFKTDKNHRTLLVQVAITISCDKFHRKLDLRHLKFRRIFDERVNSYYGHVTLTDSLTDSNDNLVKQISCTHSEVDLTSNNGPPYKLNWENKGDLLYQFGLCQLNFDDIILRNNSITNLLINDFYIKADMDYSTNIIFYVVVRN